MLCICSNSLATSPRVAELDAEADALEALVEIDVILTFKAARDTIRDACVHAENA